MLPNQPSLTQLRTAIRRATHQVLDEHIILHDPIALRLVPEAADPALIAELQREGAPDLALLRTLFAIRSRFAEDRLAEAHSRGAGQYVVFGAGFDTFPWRQPPFAHAIRIIMTDHPSSLRLAQERFRTAGLRVPDNTTYAAIDLEQPDLLTQLICSGLNQAVPTFISILGVSQYISRAALDGVLRFAAMLPRESEIVLSFALPEAALTDFDLEAWRRSARYTASIGEPWTTCLMPAELSSHLSELRFRSVFHLAPDEARERYLHSGMRVPGWERVVAAIV